MRALVAVLLVLLGCGSRALAPAASDAQVAGEEDASGGGSADAPADGPAALPDAAGSPEPDLASAPDLIAVPEADARTPDARTPDARRPDAGPPTNCERAPDSRFTACVQPGGARLYFRRRGQGGLQCGICSVAQRNEDPRPVWNCFDRTGDMPLFCVEVCEDCCYDTRGAKCDTHADCCPPLRCGSAGGKNICDLPAP
jgi:hypothetical protein